MPVEKLPPGEIGEVMYPLRDPVRMYNIDQVVAMLQKAEAAGLDLSKGCDLERLTLGQIDALVNDAGRCDA